MPNILTKAGLQRLVKKIENTKRQLKLLMSQKKEAAEIGGDAWHDNFSFEEISRQETILFNRLEKLREILNDSEIFEEENTPKELEKKDNLKLVKLNSKVVIEYENGKNATFIITDSVMSNPGAGRISYQSPLGAALMGATEGEKRNFQKNGKSSSVKIVEVA